MLSSACEMLLLRQRYYGDVGGPPRIGATQVHGETGDILLFIEEKGPPRDLGLWPSQF